VGEILLTAFLKRYTMLGRQALTRPMPGSTPHQRAACVEFPGLRLLVCWVQVREWREGAYM